MLHIAADNLLRNHGLSFALANPMDLSSITYMPMHQWPPLIGYLLAFTKLFIGSDRGVDIFLMSFGILCLFFVLKYLMLSLRLNNITRIVLWIILATNPEPFTSLGLTDLYGCLFYLLSVILCLRTIEKEKASLKWVILISAVFFLPAAFRYQYYILIFLFPLFLLFTAKLSKNKSLFKVGILSLFFVFLFLSSQMILLHFTAGKIITIADDQRGFYPLNLLKLYAFPLKGPLNISYLENHLINWGLPMVVVYKFIVWLITLFWSGYLIYLFIKDKSHLHNSSLSIIRKSRILLFLAAMVVFILLLLLSLRFHPQGTGFGSFTYLSEGRYFMLVTLLFLLLLTSFTQNNFYLKNLNRVIKVFTYAILVLNLSLFLKFIYNVATDSLPKEAALWRSEQTHICNEIVKLKLQYNRPVVTMGNRDFLYLPVKKGYAAVSDFKTVFQIGLKTTHPVIVLFITKETPAREEELFIQQNHGVHLYSGSKCQLYSIVVNNQPAQ